jgi:hypothetical protein
MARPDASALILPELRALRRRARRTYETARLRQAVLGAWPVPLAALLGLRLGCTDTHVLALGGPLLLGSIGLLWVGRDYARGVLPGLLAGVAPLVLPGLTMSCGDGCSPAAMLWCRSSCVAGGILAGLVVGWRCARFELGSVRFGVVAAGTALLTGAIGCLTGGAIGLAGMVVGFALGAVPALALVARRPS